MAGRGIYGDAKLFYELSKDYTKFSSVVQKSGTDCVILGVNPKVRPSHHQRWYETLRDTPNRDVVLYWKLPHRRGHGICFSTTGGGKNANLITPALITYAGNVLCLDPKGENAWITANRRRELGQKVVILDPWDQVNIFFGSLVGEREVISRFNPLSSIDPNSAQFSEDITLIADGVIIVSEKSDPHWSESARELVAGLIAAVIERSPGLASFRNVRDLLTDTDENLCLAVNGIVERNPKSLAGRKLRRFVLKQEDILKGKTVSDEIASIRSTAETQTAIFDAAKLLDSMETPTAEEGNFHLSELMTGKVSLFIVLPPAMLLTHGRWMRLIIQLALRAIAQVPTQPKFPTLFVLDELGTINPGGGLKMIEQAYGLLGSQGIRCWSFFQNIGQLQHDYPASWETMIANSEICQVGATGDNTTNEYFSRKLGTQTIYDGNGKAIASREVMKPYEIEKMPENCIITFPAKDDNTLLPTTPYYLEPRFDGMYRPNPRYPLPAWAIEANVFPNLVETRTAKRPAAVKGNPRTKPELDPAAPIFKGTAGVLMGVAGNVAGKIGTIVKEEVANQAAKHPESAIVKAVEPAGKWVSLIKERVGLSLHGVPPGATATTTTNPPSPAPEANKAASKSEPFTLLSTGKDKT